MPKNKRREKGDGSVYRAGDKWMLRCWDNVSVGNGEIQRKRKRIKLCPVAVEHKRLLRPPAEVLAIAQGIMTPIAASKRVPASVSTLVEFVEGVYFPQREPKVIAGTEPPRYVGLKPSTYRGYLARWKQLRPYVASLTLRDTTPTDIGNVLASVALRGLRRGTVRKLRDLLSHVFKFAVLQGLLNATPVPVAPQPNAADDGQTYPYTIGEELTMLRLLDEPARSMVAVAAFTGLRGAELRGLRWEDYDGSVINVRRNVTGKFTTTTKTRASAASVPVIPTLSKILNAHKRSINADDNAVLTGPIFANQKGKATDLTNVVDRHILPKLNVCFECGKPHNVKRDVSHVYVRDTSRPAWHGWRGFRTAAATNLHELGVDDKTIQAILRHENVKMTQDTYIKTRSSQTTKAMQEFEAFIEAQQRLQEASTSPTSAASVSTSSTLRPQ